MKWITMECKKENRKRGKQMENNENTNNRTIISGTIVSKPVYSHSVLGEDFYECFLQSNRLSGTDDVLPITISGRLGVPVVVGERYEVDGQIRSYNKVDETLGRSKLILTIFAREMRPLEADEEDRNEVFLRGFLCKEPVFRTTPFNREICDLLLACNRAYKKSDYIPLISWGRNARLSREACVGDEIEIRGRIQSRQYVKQTENGEETRVAYEVSVANITTQNARTI